MAKKHYDVNYLQNSRRLVGELKEQSYGFFKEISEGIIIDLGCGAGRDAIEMAKLAGPAVKVIGLDHDETMLAQAKADAPEAGNVAFILSEAYPLPFDDAAVAGLRTERVVQHLQNPESVITEIRRVLKDGAPLVIIETDWNSLSFYTEFVAIQKKVIAYLTDVKVNNGFAAQKLSSYLKANSFNNIKVEIHPFVVNTLEEANLYFWIEKMIAEAAEKGYIEPAEREMFYNALQRSDNEQYFACSINLVVVSCVK